MEREIAIDGTTNWGETEIAPQRLRRILGTYPTGVAVVTAQPVGGRPVGLTINSFVSLSLRLALVLWSLVDRSPSLAAFRDAPYFAIGVLAAHQAAVASRFADGKVPDKFEGVALRHTAEGPVTIDGALATLVCAREGFVHTGDHLLFIGRVCRMDGVDGEPLVFHRGRFSAVGARALAPARHLAGKLAELGSLLRADSPTCARASAQVCGI